MAKTITYKKLWKLLIDRNMSRSQLKTVTGVSTASIAKLGKGENITTAGLIKICEGLQWDLTDIMELVDAENDISPEKGQWKEQNNNGNNYTRMEAFK